MNPCFIHQLSLEELKAWLHHQNEPAFRAKQLFEWLWRHGCVDVDAMTNISLRLRESLKEAFIIRSVERVSEEASSDGETVKYLWRLYDGHMVESVLIRAPGRCTICVSSQVGCPVRCAFCASGKQGFVRDLAAAEIVGQVLAVRQELLEHEERLTNIVYMGMGEPLKNYDAVVASLRWLTDPSYLGISKRRITVSTVGIVENIVRLAKEGGGVNLALSLHAPRQELRQKLIPYARHYALDDVMKAVDQYRAITGRDTTYEYILISGINDRVEDAQELGLLVQGRQGSVNLIPYNPIAGITFQRSSTPAIAAFRAVLDRMGIVHTCRYTKGHDIAAACGQLVLREQTTLECGGYMGEAL